MACFASHLWILKHLILPKASHTAWKHERLCWLPEPCRPSSKAASDMVGSQQNCRAELQNFSWNFSEKITSWIWCSVIQEPTSMIGAVGGGQMPIFKKTSETNISDVRKCGRCCSSGWPRLLALPDPLPWWCHWSYWWNDGSHEPLESFHEERWEGPNCRISKWSLREMARMKTWAGLNKTLSRMPKMRRTRRTVWKSYKNSCYACIGLKRSFAFMSLQFFHVKHVGHVGYHQFSMWHMWQTAMWLMWLMWSGLES